MGNLFLKLKNRDLAAQNNISTESSSEEPFRPEVPLPIPIPYQIHQTLTEKDINDRSVLVIGDVHGCLIELKELVNMVHESHPNCIFIFAGDIINKGPLSIETLKYVRSMVENDEAYVIRGNHEDHVIVKWLNWQNSPDKSLVPQRKFKWTIDLTQLDIDWLCELPYTISIPHLNAIIVHAGLLPDIPLEEQNTWDMTEMRDVVVTESGERKASKLRIGNSWAAEWDSKPRPAHVYFGHDARRRLQMYGQATGLDTGCVFGGNLTGRYLTGDRSLIAVKAKKCYKNKDY